MSVALSLAAAILVQFALQSVHVWSALAACQPVLIVLVASARRLRPTSVAWLGLVAGLATDLLAGRVIGPGGIAGAAAGAMVAHVIRKFELEGPLFWIVGSLLAASSSEVAWFALMASHGSRPDHGPIGVLAAVATTGMLGLVVAAAERSWAWWVSPERRRRRGLRNR